jgi:hypothetical protein
MLTAIARLDIVELAREVAALVRTDITVRLSELLTFAALDAVLAR